jgi:pyridoxal phosphate enzyme (YggS family)
LTFSENPRDRLQKLNEEVINIQGTSYRSKSDPVRLIAVSKTHGPEVVEPLIKAGQIIFGENRVQEARAKWPDLKARYPKIELHLIGPLQRNKVSLALKVFDVIQTIDRLKLAKTVANHINKDKLKTKCFIQVNTGEEPQKSGVAPKDADAFISQCILDLGLPVVGLMCIPPSNEEASLHFALLRQIADRNNLKELSMGMSADYSIAINFGATYVRIGSSIFGPRSDYHIT